MQFIIIARFSSSFPYFPDNNLGQKVGDKFTKLSKIGFSMECFTEFGFWGDDWELAVKSKYFRDFLEIC